MIEIKKAEDNALAESFIKQFVPQANLADSVIMTATQNGEIIGAGALQLRKSKVFLTYALNAENEKSLTLGIMRALLNWADLQGIKTVYGTNPDLNAFYTMLLFQKNDTDEYTLALEGYFTQEHCTL